MTPKNVKQYIQGNSALPRKHMTDERKFLGRFPGRIFKNFFQEDYSRKLLRKGFSGRLFKKVF